MRTKKELLQILLDNIDQLKSGLCVLIIDLWDARVITRAEFNILDCHLESHWIDFRPEPGGYYWKIGDKEIRAEWLKKQIETEERNGR